MCFFVCQMKEFLSNFRLDRTPQMNITKNDEYLFDVNANEVLNYDGFRNAHDRISRYFPALLPFWMAKFNVCVFILWLGD